MTKTILLEWSIAAFYALAVGSSSSLADDQAKPLTGPNPPANTGDKVNTPFVSLVLEANKTGTKRDFAKAASLFREALKIAEVDFGPKDRRTAECLRGLAITLGEQFKFDEAEPLLLKAATIYKSLNPPEPRMLGETCFVLASIECVLRRPEEAETDFKRAITLFESKTKPDDLQLARCFARLTLAMMIQGKYSEAEPIIHRHIELLENQGKKDSFEMSNALFALSNIHMSRKEKIEAEPLVRRTLEIREKIFGNEHPVLLNPLIALIMCSERKDTKGDDKFLQEFEINLLKDRALMIAEKTMNSKRPLLVPTLWIDMAQVFASKGKHDQAKNCYRSAIAMLENGTGGQILRESGHGLDNPMLDKELERYAGFLREIGSVTEAEEVEDQIRKLKAN